MIELAEQYNEAHPVSENPFKQPFVNTNEGRSDVMRKDNFSGQGPEEFRQKRYLKIEFVMDVVVKIISSEIVHIKLSQDQIQTAKMLHREE